LLGLTSGLISSLLIVILSFTDLREIWLPVATSVIVAVVFALVAYRGYAQRYYYLALFSLAFGAIAALIGPSDLGGLAIYYGGMGLVQLASGTIVFRNFLDAYDLAGEEE